MTTATARGLGQKTHIYVMNADGSRQRRLTHGHVHFSVAWSPDGQKMLFERMDTRHPRGPVPGEGPEELHVMNADGSGQRRLTRTPVREGGPAWSPDGRRIAFDSGSQIWLMNPNGSGKRSLTPARWWGSVDRLQSRRRNGPGALRHNRRRKREAEVAALGQNAWARRRSPLGLVARAEVVRSERRVGSAAPEASSPRPPLARAPRS